MFPKLSLSRLSNNPSTCLSLSFIRPCSDSTRATISVALSSIFFQRRYQPIHISMEIWIRPNRYAVSVNKFSETGWQGLFTGHFRAAHQERDHRDASLQSGLISILTKSVGSSSRFFPSCVTCIQPVVTNDREQDITFSYLLVQVFFEIKSQRD